MFDHKRDKNDDKLYPDRKYKGILHSPRRTYPEDEVPVASRRVQPDASKHRRFSDLFVPAVRKSGPSARRRGSASQHKPAPAADSFFSRLPSRGQDPNGLGGTSGRGSRRGGGTKSHGSFFRDGMIKATLLICAFIAVGSVIAIPTAFARPTTDITINDSGRILAVSTAAGTVGECLTDNKIELGAEDILAQEADTPISEGMEIKIWRAMPVTVNSGTETITVNMVTGTVQDALDNAGIVPAAQDEVYPSLDTPIRTGMKIDHIVVEVEQKSVVHDIPFDKVEREDSKLAKGDTEIVQEGETGELEIITEYLYKNGVLVSEEVISEETLKEPVDQVTAVGTYVAPKKKSTPTISSIHKGEGGSIDGMNVKYTLQMEVTAYCSACNHGNRTASGTYPQRGTVAANLGVLPMGTKLYIPGYGTGVVEDTGGFASNVIDVYLGDRSSCSCGAEWGRKNLTISVLG